jgi:hypothetical protein
MTWSFDVTQLATSSLFQVRILIGDTDTSDQQLQDEQITIFTTGGALAAGSIYLAAAQCCEAIASAYARQVTTKIGTTSALLSDRVGHYRQRAKDLRAQNARYAGVNPYSGGISISDMDVQTDNTDRVNPDFSTTGDDDPATRQTISPSGLPWGWGA